MSVTRTCASLSFVFFLSFLAPALCADESQACSVSGKDGCKAVSQAIEDDSDHGLELLQLKGSRSSRICPVPDILSAKTSFSTTGKGCPKPDKEELKHGAFGSKCVDGNRAYDSFSDAWEKCGLTLHCGAVMKYSDGRFYLRRESDPDDKTLKNIKMFVYDCPSAKEEKEEIYKAAHKEAKRLYTKMRSLEQVQEEHEIEDEEARMKEQIAEEESREKISLQNETEFARWNERRVEVMSERAKEAPKEIKEETREAADAYSKLETAEEVDDMAIELTKHDHEVAKKAAELAKKLEDETLEVEEDNSKYEERASTAADALAETEELESHLKAVKKRAKEDLKEAKAKIAKVAKERKDSGIDDKLKVVGYGLKEAEIAMKEQAAKEGAVENES